MERQQDLQLLSDRDTIVAELRGNWAKYADDEGIISITACVREYRYTDKDIAEAGLLALSNILGCSKGATVSGFCVEACFEHVPIAIDSASGDVVLAGCLLIEEASKRKLLESILFTTNFMGSGGSGSQTSTSPSASGITLKTSSNGSAGSSVSSNNTIRRRTGSISAAARRYTHHHGGFPGPRFQADDLKASPPLVMATAAMASAPPSAVRLVRGILKALSTHAAAEAVQSGLLKALTVMENIKSPCICEAIRESNGTTQIIQALTTHIQNPQVQEFGLLALEGIIRKTSSVIITSQKANDISKDNNSKDTNDNNTNKLTSSKAVEYAIGAMNRLPESSGVQAAGCKVLARLAQGNGTNQAMIAASGGFDAVVNALRNHATAANVQAAGCLAVGYLTENNKATQAAAAQCGVLEETLRALRARDQEDAEVQENALFALGSATSDNAENTLALCNAGGVEDIVAALGAHGSVERTQRNGCYALLNMSCNAEGITKLCAGGGIAAVIRAMYTHLECEDIQEFGCCILGSIAKDTECGPYGVSEIMVEGGIEAIIRAMKRYNEVFQIQNLGLFAVTYIVSAAAIEVPTTVSPISTPSPPPPSHPTQHGTSSNDQQQQQMTLSMLSSASSTITTPTITSARSPSLAPTATRGFAPPSPTKGKGRSENNSTSRVDEALKRIEECGGIEVIICTVKAYRDIPQAQEFGLALLAKIAEHNGSFCAQQILTGREARGAFGTIIGSLMGHLNKEESVQSMCYLIGVVAKNARDHCHISEAALVANGLEGVTAAMERYPQNASIQRNALCALAYISSWSLTFRERVGARGGVVRALCAMEAYPDDQRLQTYGVQAFAGMAARCPENRSLIGAKGGLSSIAAAMAFHAANEGLQRASCLAISCLLVDSPENRDLARTGGCVERLVAAMLAFPDSERLQMLASAALIPLLSPVIESEKRRKERTLQKAKRSSSGNISTKKSSRYFDKAKDDDMIDSIGVSDKESVANDINGNSTSNNNYDYDDASSSDDDNEGEGYASKIEEDNMNTDAMRAKQEKWLCNPVPGERAALAAMARFPGSQVVQEAGCIILSVLPQSREEAGGSHDLDRVDAVLGAIREHGATCKRIRSCGCAALAAIMKRCAGCAERICSVPGSIPAIVEAIKAPHIGASTRANGCSVVAGVLHDVYTSHSEVRKCGGIHAIVKAMEKQAGNIALQRAGCKALAAFTAPPPTSTASPYAATAGDEDISCMIAAGGIVTLLRTMARNAADAEVQCLGCKALARIAGSGKGPTGKQCDDAADLTAAALSRHTQDAELQKWACIALLRLCQLPGGSVGVHKRMSEGQGIAAVVAAMRRTPENAEVNTWGSLALGAAAHGDRECQRRIAAEGGIATIIDALWRFEDDAEMQRAGCLALAYIAANNSDTQRKVGFHEGISAIVYGMERHAENEDVQRYGCLAIGYAALSNKENQDLVANLPRGVEDVVDAMTRFPDAKDVQVNGCFALIATAVHPELQKRAAAAGGATAVVGALARFPNVKHLQDSGVLGLLRLGTPDPALQRRAERVVSPDSVATTFSKFADSEVAREWCVHTLANVVRAGRPCPTRPDTLPDLLVGIISRSWQANPLSLLLDACTLLGHIAARGAVEVTTRIRSAKGVEALLALVAHPPPQATAAGSLKRESEASAAAAPGAVSTAVIATPQDLLREAFFALSNIVKEPGGANAARFVGAHGIEITVQALTRYTDNEELQSNACATLGNAARDNEDFQRRVSERGGVDAIANTMVVFPDAKILLTQCCNALGAITLNCVDAQNIACKHKCLELITDFLAHTASPAGRESACYAIRCLTSGNRATQTHLITSNGYESVIQAINSSVNETAWADDCDDKEASSRKAVLKDGLLMLMDLTQVTKIAQKRVEEEVSAKALLAFMDDPTCSTDERVWCLRILACVFSSMTPARWESIDAAAALKTVVAVMDANITTEQVQHYGCFALATILRGRIAPAVIDCAYKEGALETAIAAMGHYPENMKIQNNALFSLDALASAANAAVKYTDTESGEGNSDSAKLNINALVLGPAGCLEAAVGAMERFPDFAQIQMLGASVVASAGRSTRYNKFVLRAVGCTPVLVRALERYRKDIVISRTVCTALASLAADSPPDQREIAECKGVDAVMTTMAQYPDNRDIQFACVDVFGHLTVPEALEPLLPRTGSIGNSILSGGGSGRNAKLNVPRGRKNNAEGEDDGALDGENEGHATPNNGIRIITETVVRYANDADIQREALSALANVAEVFPSASKAVAINGGVGAAIIAMHKFPDDPRMQSSGCRILRAASGTLLEEEAKKAFEAIAAAAARHTDVLAVQESAMLAIKALLDSGFAPEAEVKYSIVETSAKVLPLFPESSSVQEGGFAALSTSVAFSAAPEADAARFCGLGVFELAVAAMQRFHDSLGVQEEACSLLAELAGERAPEDPSALCECVAASMLRYRDSARLQCLGCAVFASLPAVTAPAVVDVAVSALQNHLLDEDVVLNACLVVALAAHGDEAIKAHVCELCTVESVVVAMREHAVNRDVQGAACAALCALPQSLGVRIALNDGCNMVARAVERFPEDEQLLKDGIGALAKAAAEVELAECLVLQSYGGTLPESPIVVALRAHPGSEALNRDGFALLARVLHSTENIRRIIGSVSAFVDSVGVPALKRYAQNPAIIPCVLDVIAVVTEDLSGARTFAGVGGLAFVHAAATAHPEDLAVQELCATVVARIVASDTFHKRFATKELQAAAEGIAERLRADSAHAAAGDNLLVSLRRDKEAASTAPPGVCHAQRLFRCVTCSIVRGSCVNFCPKCHRSHHSPSHRVVELFYPAACSCCARLNCTQHKRRERPPAASYEEMCVDYSTPVLPQRIDSLLDALPPLQYHSLADSLAAAGFRDAGALMIETREKLLRDVVDNTALGLTTDNALAIYICTHNATLASGEEGGDEVTTPIAVVNKALHDRTPDALYRVRYLLLHLLIAVRRLPRVSEKSVLYRVIIEPPSMMHPPSSYTSLSTLISPPLSPFRSAAAGGSAGTAVPKKGNELFQWPCITSAFTDEAEALAVAKSIGPSASICEIHGPITAYHVGPLTGRRSEVLLDIETRFEVMEQSPLANPADPAASAAEDGSLMASAPADLDGTDPTRMWIRCVADPSGNGLPIAGKLKAFIDIIANFSPLRGTAIFNDSTTTQALSKPTLANTFGVLSQGFYTPASQALQAAGFKHLFEDMHERYMMYVAGSPESRAFMREWDITEEDAAIIFSFTYNNGTENSPYAVVGRGLQDPEQQMAFCCADDSAEGIHVSMNELAHSGDNIPLAGISIRYDRVMSVRTLQHPQKHSTSLSARILGPLDDMSLAKKPKQTLSLHSIKSTPASASLPTLPKMKAKSKPSGLQGYVLHLLMALRKLPRYRESDTVFVPAEGDNLDMRKFFPGKTVVWDPLMIASPSKKEALVILNFCKTRKPVLFEIRGPFYGYNVSRLSSSPSVTEIVLEPETNLRVVSVSSESDSFLHSYFKIVVEAVEMQTLPLESAVREFTLNAPVPGVWTRDIDPVTQKIYYINYPANRVQLGYPSRTTPADIFKQPPKTTSIVPLAIPTGSTRDASSSSSSASAASSTDTDIQVPSLHVTNVAKHSVTLLWDAVPSTPARETVYNVTRQIPGIDTTKAFIYKGKGTSVTGDGHIAGVTYQYRIRAGTIEKRGANSAVETWGPWSGPLTVSTPKSPFSECGWRPCETSYRVSGFPTRFATKTSEDSTRSVVLGNTILEKGKWYSWSVRIIRSGANNGDGIYVGVAPVDGFAAMGKLHGWYLYCKNISPFSDPTAEYDEPAEFVPPENGIRSGSVIGMKMDTGTGKLFFSIDGVETGIYFYGIPLDDEVPIVPSVALNCKDDIVELII